MRRWSRGRLEVPSSVREVRGCARRASTRELAEPGADCVEDWAWVADDCWVWDCVSVCVEGGSAGGVRGAAGDAILNESREDRRWVDGCKPRLGTDRESVTPREEI